MTKGYEVRKGTAWVTPYSGIEAEEVAKARETLLKKGEAIFSVCCLDFINEYYLLGDSTEFIVAQELNLPIKLVEYDEDDFVHISKLDFTTAQFPELVDENVNVRIGDFFERYMWDGDMYKVEVEITFGEATYTLTPKEQEMKLFTPFESGVAVHKAYIELGMDEDSDLEVYQRYYIQKCKDRDKE